MTANNPKTTAKKPDFATLVDQSECLGYWTNLNRETSSSLWWYKVSLYRHPDGRYFVGSHGGGGMNTGEYRWISDQDAREFLIRHAQDSSGWGYTPDEADQRLAGKEVKGTGPVPERPDGWL